MTDGRSGVVSLSPEGRRNDPRTPAALDRGWDRSPTGRGYLTGTSGADWYHRRLYAASALGLLEYRRFPYRSLDYRYYRDVHRLFGRYGYRRCYSPYYGYAPYWYGAGIDYGYGLSFGFGYDHGLYATPYRNSVVYLEDDVQPIQYNQYTTIYTTPHEESVDTDRSPTSEGVVYDAPTAGGMFVPSDPVSADPRIEKEDGGAGPNTPASPQTQEPQNPDDRTTPIHPVDRGHEYFRESNYLAARGEFMRAVLNDERDGFAKLFYALSSFAIGDFEASTSALRRALVVEPELVVSPIDLRQFYAKDADLGRQVEALRSFIVQRSERDDARLLLAYVLYSTAQPEEAHFVLVDLAARQPADELVAMLRDEAARVIRTRDSQSLESSGGAGPPGHSVPPGGE